MGKNDIKISYCLVAFVDLLGQKNELEKLNKLPLPGNEAEKEELIEKVKATYGVVIKFRETFEKRFTSELQRNKPSSLPAEYQKMLEDSAIKFQTFSDGLVVYTSLDEQSERLPIIDVYRILGACTSAFLLFLSLGKPIRGGIEIGIGMVTEKYGIYAPVVADAYQLENEVAEYPRIVVGEKLKEYLKLEKKHSQNSIIGQFRKSMAETCENIIITDKNGISYLDFLGKSFKDDIAGDSLGDVPSQAYKFVLKEISVFEKENNRKLLDRYRTLKEYMDSRMNLWD
jgi:hypothetical protein